MTWRTKWSSDSKMYTGTTSPCSALDFSPLICVFRISSRTNLTARFTNRRATRVDVIPQFICFWNQILHISIWIYILSLYFPLHESKRSSACSTICTLQHSRWIFMPRLGQNRPKHQHQPILHRQRPRNTTTAAQVTWHELRHCTQQPFSDVVTGDKCVRSYICKTLTPGFLFFFFFRRGN